MKVAILRPEPGASATLEAARRLGISAIAAPLFTVRPLEWTPPDPAGFDALLLTSANAARHGGPGLARYADRPLLAVGPATAEAARRAGLTPRIVGDGDVAALVSGRDPSRHGRILHLCGADRRALASDGVMVLSLPVYESVAAEHLPPQILNAHVILLHSPRAGITLRRLGESAGLEPARHAIVAISAAAAQTAGPGWERVEVAPAPSDSAMLAIASSLCDKAAS